LSKLMLKLLLSSIFYMVKHMKDKEKMLDAFDSIIDNIKYAKRLVYIKCFGSFDKKK